MDALATAFIAIGLLLILLLIVYLVDRVNTIEKETRRMALSMSQGSSDGPKSAKAPFAGLSGRRLWEAMIGKGADNLSDDVLAELRERYDLVLHKHLESLYKEGWRDGERRRFESHPLIGEATLHDIADLAGAGRLIRAQHEHVDGTGFPDRQGGDHIIRCRLRVPSCLCLLVSQDSID